jgi:hypothetical protein
MAQKTELSLLALPGMMHGFSAKAEAEGIRAFGEGAVTVVGKFSGMVTNEGKYDGTVSVEGKLDGTVTLNE